MSTSTIGSTTRGSTRPVAPHRAIDWLCKTFGFERHFVAEDPDGGIAHAQLTLGRGMIMLGGHRDDAYGRMMRSPAEVGHNTQSLYVVVADADAHLARARAAGADVVLDIEDKDYGGRGDTCKDLEGHIWSFGTYDPWSRHVRLSTRICPACLMSPLLLGACREIALPWCGAMRYSRYMAVQVTVDFPDDAFAALRKSPADFASELKQAAVCKWFELGIVSQSRAAELLGATREYFLDVLARHRVSPLQSTVAELREELDRG